MNGGNGAALRRRRTTYIFTSRQRLTPFNFKNWIDRTLTPAATEAGFERISYHMFRRGLATETSPDGVVDKNIQSQLRHADPELPATIYMRKSQRNRQRP